MNSAANERTATEPMSHEQAAVLADFARTCKAAARSVSLYPATHPAIQSSLSRIVAATERLTPAGHVTLTVFPDRIVIDRKAPARPDAAIGELAALLHERLIGSLRIDHAADAQDWHTLLRLLGRPPEDLIAEGGIGRVWTASGRDHFEIREIDYAEVLRERAGGDAAEWSRIIAHCLHSDAATLDDRAIASMIETFGDPERLRAFLDTLQNTGGDSGETAIGARAAALLALLRRALDVAGKRSDQDAERIFQTVADAAPRLTPEMMLALAGERRVVDRMSDSGIASFVANSVMSERGATERLAQAFQVLVPEAERKARLLELAKTEAGDSPPGGDDQFENLWQSAASMLTSYSDESYVSAAYDRELSGAPTQAIEVDRVSDDPPERVQEWLGSVSDDAVRQLDLSLLQDLLRLETEPAKWQEVAMIGVAEIERRTLLGEVDKALHLAGAIVKAGEGEREGFGAAVEAALNKIAGGPLVRHIVTYLRKGNERDAEPLNGLCQAIGPRLARPLAEALAVEDNNRVILRLRELLVAFGAAGRQSVERLKNSSNPAVRRMAIDLLRVFGGREALPELASMLDDADPQVQRESIRAIVQIATNEAYAVLERALVAGSAARETVLQELIGLRDDKAIPLLCYVLNHSEPRGKLVEVHAQIIEALGGLNAHKESTRTLRAVLHRGQWWAPYRTAALRRTAATALRRIGAPETIAVLEDAVAHGTRGVRSAARAQLERSGRRERARS